MTIWDIPGGQYLFCTINLKNGMFNFDSLYSLLKHWIYSLTDLIYNFKSAPPPAYLLPPSPTIAPTPAPLSINRSFLPISITHYVTYYVGTLLSTIWPSSSLRSEVSFAQTLNFITAIVYFAKNHISCLIFQLAPYLAFRIIKTKFTTTTAYNLPISCN